MCEGVGGGWVFRGWPEGVAREVLETSELFEQVSKGWRNKEVEVTRVHKSRLRMRHTTPSPGV